MTVAGDAAALAAPDTVSRAGLRRVLTVLCITEITSWGVLYYAFPVLAAQISVDTGWSMTMLTGTFSAALVVAALVGVPVGRWLDRHGPRMPMTAGSIVAVPAVAMIATAESPVWFAAGWVLAGVAMGAVLYPPAFAALTRWHGARRVRALTILTLVAGLASTVFAPLTAALAAHLTWRETYVVLAVILAVVTIPAHWFGLRLPWPEHQESASAPVAEPSAVARSRSFLALTVALSLGAFAAIAAVINLVPLLLERGIDTGTAALALGLAGAGQVAGRLGYAALARRTRATTRAAVVILAIAVTSVLLGLATSVTALIVTAVLAGMARGQFTLVQATAVTDRWGAGHYGRLTGLLSAPLTVTMALAPFGGAALAALLGGQPAMFIALGGLAVVAAALALATAPRPVR